MFGSHPPIYLRPLCTVRMDSSSEPPLTILLYAENRKKSKGIPRNRVEFR